VYDSHFESYKSESFSVKERRQTRCQEIKYKTAAEKLLKSKPMKVFVHNLGREQLKNNLLNLKGHSKHSCKDLGGVNFILTQLSALKYSAGKGKKSVSFCTNA